MSTYLGNQLISGKNRPDGSTIDYNSSGRLQAAGALNRNSGGSPVKFWTGTRAEYDAIETKDPGTLYNVTDDATDQIGSGMRRLGEIVTSTIPLTDAWLHLLDGSLLNGNGSYKGFVDYVKGLYDSGSYSDLFITEANWQASVTTYGVCGKFVYDSTNNTVRLPKITGIIEGTTDLTALGDLVEAGLPNITGKTGYYCSDVTPPSGSFFKDTSGSVDNNSGKVTAPELGFDASLSNSIYGNSSTVQPQSIKVLYYIVIATLTKTEIEVDIDEIATDLNGKADKDLTNTIGSWSSSSKNYVTTLAHELDWNNVIGVSTTSSGQWQTYTAPSDGLFITCVYCSADSGISCGIDSSNSSDPPVTGCTSGGYVSSYRRTASASEYIVRGQTIKYCMYANANIVYISARFVPLKKS